MNFTIILIGARAAQRSMDRTRRRFNGATAAAVMQAGYKIMAEAVKITPLATGRLRRSWFVSSPRMTGSGPEVMIGFGTGYAWAVHEKTGDNVSWTAPGTGPKYLERPLDAFTGRYAKWIAAKAWDNFRLGITARQIQPRRETSGG